MIEPHFEPQEDNIRDFGFDLVHNGGSLNPNQTALVQQSNTNMFTEPVVGNKSTSLTSERDFSLKV